MKHFKSVQYKAREASGSGSIPRDGSVGITWGFWNGEVQACGSMLYNAPAIAAAPPATPARSRPQLCRHRLLPAACRRARISPVPGHVPPWLPPGRQASRDGPDSLANLSPVVSKAGPAGDVLGHRESQSNVCFFSSKFIKKTFINIWYV